MPEAMPGHSQIGAPEDESVGTASGELERARKKPSNLRDAMPEAMPDAMPGHCLGNAGRMPFRIRIRIRKETGIKK